MADANITKLNPELQKLGIPQRKTARTELGS